MLIPEAICYRSFSYCVMIGYCYCGRFRQMNMVTMLQVDGESTVKTQAPNFSDIEWKR
jgi:hypothetical protein